jgi:hypothetical protein
MSDEQTKALQDFLAKHVTPYDPATDDYERPPFAADIKEGKNDPIYNAHSYHTKVPPRGIIPYILHYTKPGDLVLDPFCGSGMTGVAAQMCANPPADILEQFPELKDRVGPRACILNDLSPAACHIAYNYNTPVDVAALKREFERIKAAVKDEFDRLYGTEHYEPAVGDYDPDNADVTARLKNPPKKVKASTLIGDEERTWELLTKKEVEDRLGYSVKELLRDDNWGKLDLNKVKHWISVPATIQYTVWSSVFKCEGFVTLEEPTGKISTRGKNVGKPITQKRSVGRGCRKEFLLWDVGIDPRTYDVLDNFKCPHCGQGWTADNATLVRAEPTEVIYNFIGFRPKDNEEMVTRRRQRSLSALDRQLIKEMERTPIKHWYPQTKLVPGEEGYRLINRGITSVDKVYTTRNLAALARLWAEFSFASDERLRRALQFIFTSVSVGICSRMTRYNFGKRGNGAMAMRLFMPHFQAEANVLKVFAGKVDDIVGYFSASRLLGSQAAVITRPAQELNQIPDATVDFIFADPPFGRNIAYAELNVLWEAWLGQLTDVPKEAITSNGRKWGVENYAEKMSGAFKEMFRVLKPGRFSVVEFNNADPELRLFEEIKRAALNAGFEIANMALLDKKHKSYNQVVGSIRGEDTVDKDVIFNLHKPAMMRKEASPDDRDLEQQVVEVVRSYLQALPERIKTDPRTYNEEHRTASTLHSVLMNALIPKGVSVGRLNLPLIERVCARYFRKKGQRWYLRGEAVGGNGGDAGLVTEEIAIKDELSAIAWLRQKLQSRPMSIGELKPLWNQATGPLPTSLSQSLILEDLLSENFWRDQGKNCWREPTTDERERMNDDRSLRVLHDAGRFLNGTLKRQTTDEERCEWIDVLFKACRAIEENEAEALPALRGFDANEAYVVITRLFQSVLRDHVSATAFARAEKQNVATSRKLNVVLDSQATETAKARRKDNPAQSLLGFDQKM